MIAIFKLWHEKRSLLVMLIALSALLCRTDNAQAEKPNVVIVLADDQGWGDLSLHGNTNLHTPNIDSLAKTGAMFERFFVCPVCSPTRAEFLTGRYHSRGGVFSTSTGGERLDLDEKTIAQTFQAAGYATGAFGKWHNGMQYPYHPNGRGFDEYYGFCSGHWGHYFSPILEHNGKRVRGKGYVTDDFTNHALKFMEESQQKKKPFFCYLPYCIPHSPMQVPEEFFKKFNGTVLEKRHRDPQQEDVPKTRAALAMCENIDWNVGRVLKKLDIMDIADNTIVIYFSDNGPNSSRWNGRMKGRKGSTDEGGVRVPFVIKWPKAIDPGIKISRIAGAIDLLPTLADLAGIPVKSDNPLDGISLKPLLTGAKVQWPDRMIFSRWRDKVSVRTQQFRLDNNGQLFDMTQDPEQRRNIAPKHPEVVERLRKEQSKFRLIPVSLRREDRPFTVGYPEFPITHLPARDGVPHGQIQRSARAPNCSFFTRWKSTEDSITWDVDVNTAGTYDVTVYYTCKKDDVGCQIALAYQSNPRAKVRLIDQKTGKVVKNNVDVKASTGQVKVTIAHDPPLIGAKEDRVPRKGESYVKDFRPLSLGEIKLIEGRGTLTLKATDIPGDAAIEVREIELTLKP